MPREYDIGGISYTCLSHMSQYADRLATVKLITDRITLYMVSEVECFVCKLQLSGINIDNWLKKTDMHFGVA